MGRTLWALLRREWQLEWRTRQTVVATGLFASIVALILSLSVSTTSAVAQPMVQAALLWIALTFATTLGLGRAFAREREEGALDGLLLIPADWVWIYVAKLASTLAFTLLTHTITLGLFAVLLELSLDAGQLVRLLPLIAAVTLGHVAVGLLLSALTVSLRAREVLLPVLLLPLLVPLLLAAISGTEAILTEFVGLADPREAWRWFLLVGVFDLVYLALGVALFAVVLR